MANDKFYGYSPDASKEEEGNRLDRLNPYEFRKGMDYELTALGCSRLAESTVEEREKATKSVIKNLEEYGGYYTSLITYETLFRNSKNKPSFKSWLKEQENNQMTLSGGLDKGFDLPNSISTSSKSKENQMTEPKYDKKEYTVPFQTAALKEAIKRKIYKTLMEVKKDEEEETEDEKDNKASKSGKKIEKGMSRFENEKKSIDKLLFGEIITLTDKQISKGEKEVSKENPAEGSLLHRKNENLENYKTDKDVENYKNLIKLTDNEIKSLKDHEEEFGSKGLGNNFILKDIQGDDLPTTIKKLEARKVSIDKEISAETSKVGLQRNEIAATDMTRADQINLLNIIKENGVSLREGSDSIKHYYEIAKRSFLEGLAKGLKL